MHMSSEGLLVIVAVGLAAGWLAGEFVEGTGFGLLGDMVIGIIGGFIGDWLLPQLGLYLGTGIVAAIVNATIGAVVLLLIIRLIRGRGRWGGGGRWRGGRWGSQGDFQRDGISPGGARDRNAAADSFGAFLNDHAPGRYARLPMSQARSGCDLGWNYSFGILQKFSQDRILRKNLHRLLQQFSGL